MYDLLLINFAPVTGIVCILIFLYTNSILDKRITSMFKLTTYLAILELVAYSAELWTATWAHPSMLRVFLSVVGYTLRPLMLYCILVMILRNHPSKRRKVVLLIPTLVVCLASCTAFFTDIAFTYTQDNQFVRGPLGYLYFVAVLFYFLVALVLSARLFHQNGNLEGLINFVIILMNAVAIGAEAIWQIRGLGGSSMVYSIIFYYMYFQTQNTKKEALEQAQIVNRSLQEKNTIIGALSTEYSSIFIIDWDSARVRLFTLLDRQYEFAAKMVSWCKYYDEAVEAYLKGAILEEERAELREKMNFQRIKQELSEQEIYYVNFHRTLQDVDDHAQFVFSVVPGEDGGKSIVLAIRSINDIVEWEQQKKELLEENLRYMEVVNALAAEYSSVLYFDPHMEHVIPYRLQDVSEEFVRVLEDGISYRTLLENYIDKVVYEEDREKVRAFQAPEYLMKQLEKNGQCSCTYRLEKEGRLLYYEAKAVRTGNREGHFGVVVGFANKDEEIRREMQYQETLERALDRAEQANKSKSIFLFNMSHDIRTPMNGILGFIDIAKRSIGDDKKVEEALGKIQMSGMHLLQLINEILDMSRVENNKVVLNEKPVSIRQAASKLEDMLKADVDKKGQTLIVEFVKLEQDYVYMDELRCNQIALNILSNAVKYTGEGGTIRFRVEQKGEIRQSLWCLHRLKSRKVLRSPIMIGFLWMYRCPEWMVMKLPLLSEQWRILCFPIFPLLHSLPMPLRKTANELWIAE